MGFPRTRRLSALAASFVTVAATTTLAVLGLSTAAPAAQGGTGPCPQSNALANFQTDPNVAATLSSSGATTTYTFISKVDEGPVSGVPGLIKYCVYPPTAPESATATYDKWTYSIGSDNFAFGRAAGNKTNIPLDGKTTEVGTATWTGNAPTEQIILLHIADPKMCASLYPGTAPSTCFVKPAPPGPICDDGAGLTTAAYNAMPFGVIDCSKPSWAFEGRSTNEFGNGVNLATGTPRTLDSLNVLFTSYACSDSGKWYTGDCVSTQATFTHTITARIYDPSISLTAPIATETKTFTDIPYRPSGDLANCPAADGLPAGSRWLNPNTGMCQYSISKILTFTDWGATPITLPDTVVWTVAFNTTNAGYEPIGPTACSATTVTGPGCPYDSLNVGTMTFDNAPYAGSDSNVNEAYVSQGTKTSPLVVNTTAYGDGEGWAPYTPLASITTVSP